MVPDELAIQLGELGVKSRNESGRVLIEIELPKGDSWENNSQRSLASSQSDAEARDFVGGVLDESLPIQSGVFHIEIVHLADRIIRNIRIKRDRKIGVKYFSIFDKEIKQVLTRQGFLAVTNEVQGSISRQHCSDSQSIETIEMEIENHRRAKEKFVECQEYEEAARALHLEYMAREQLDALVREHLID